MCSTVFQCAPIVGYVAMYASLVSFLFSFVVVFKYYTVHCFIFFLFLLRSRMYDCATGIKCQTRTWKQFKKKKKTIFNRKKKFCVCDCVSSTPFIVQRMQPFEDEWKYFCEKIWNKYHNVGRKIYKKKNRKRKKIISSAIKFYRFNIWNVRIWKCLKILLNDKHDLSSLNECKRGKKYIHINS